MSIRFRVYPQFHSVGARRNRARRRQQLNQSFAWQQQLLRQQAQQRIFGFGSAGGFGAFGGVGSFGGMPGGFYQPAASSWGLHAMPGAFSPVSAAWSGAYGVPAQGYGGYQSSYASTSPFGVSQYGVSQHGVSQHGGSVHGSYGC